MWRIGKITTEYFTIPSVDVTPQFSCVTAVIFVVQRHVSLHILSITTDVKLLATIYVVLEQAMYELFSIYRNYKCNFPGVFK